MLEQNRTLITTMDSPLGELLLRGDGEHLTGLFMQEQQHVSDEDLAGRRDPAVFAEAIAQLRAYFAAELRQFDLPLRLIGTDFQRRCWTALLDIPFGETRSYGEQARRINAPKASRAVGLANGRNPISIIVPCHRVIGANGQLTGYGGGLERKRWLLQHETRSPAF